MIVACPNCKFPLVRAERGVQRALCGRCLLTFEVARGSLLRRVSRVVTDAEPGFLFPGRYHREEELRVDVGTGEPFVVPFTTKGPWDNTPLKDGDDVVVLGQVDSGHTRFLEVREVGSGANIALSKVQPPVAGCLTTLGCLGAVILFVVLAIWATWTVALLAPIGLAVAAGTVDTIFEKRKIRRLRDRPEVLARLKEQSALLSPPEDDVRL